MPTFVKKAITHSLTGGKDKTSLAFLLEMPILHFHITIIFFSPWRYKPIVGVYFTALYRALASSRTRFLDHTRRRATVGRTPLE